MESASLTATRPARRPAITWRTVRMAVLYEVMSAHPPARAEEPAPEPSLA